MQMLDDTITPPVWLLRWRTSTIASCRRLDPPRAHQDLSKWHRLGQLKVAVTLATTPHQTPVRYYSLRKDSKALRVKGKPLIGWPVVALQSADSGRRPCVTTLFRVRAVKFLFLQQTRLVPTPFVGWRSNPRCRDLTVQGCHPLAEAFKATSHLLLHAFQTLH